MKFEEVTGPSAISPEERERSRKLLALRDETDAARGAFWRTLLVTDGLSDFFADRAEPSVGFGLELAYLLEQGKRGRDELVQRLAQEGQEHLSRAWRQPVV